MLIILKADCFQFWFLYNSDLWISYCRKTYINSQSWTLINRENNNNIFHIIDQIKVSRVPCESGIDIFAWRVTKNYIYRNFVFMFHTLCIIPVSNEELWLVRVRSWVSHGENTSSCMMVLRLYLILENHSYLGENVLVSFYLVSLLIYNFFYVKTV